MPPTNLAISTSKQDTRLELKLAGRLDGTSDYSAIPRQGVSEISMDFEGISLIDSVGVQGWTRFMESIEPQTKVIYRRCSVRIINQMNMFKGFCGGKNVAVESFFAPYYCEGCDESSDFLIESAPILASGSLNAPELPCPKCKTAMEFDGVEDRYFSFLKPAS